MHKAKVLTISMSMLWLIVGNAVNSAGEESAEERIYSGTIILDGTSGTIESRPRSNPYDTIILRNGAQANCPNTQNYVKQMYISEDSQIVAPDSEYSPLPIQSASGSGGSHGGKGGGSAPGGIYGDLETALNSMTCGSKGGAGLIETVTYCCSDKHLPFPFSTEPGYWGTGGGGIVIVADYLELNGMVDVCGLDGKPPGGAPQVLGGNPTYNYRVGYGGGGGSGGGVLLVAKELHIGPSARILANGGHGGEGYAQYISNTTGSLERHGYAGGGGRIKIFYETGTISASATIEAKAGWEPRELPPELAAEDGSIYIQQVSSIDTLLGYPPTPTGDLNQDGKVNFKDMATLMGEWQSTYALPPTSTPIITPSGGHSIVNTPTASPTFHFARNKRGGE